MKKLLLTIILFLIPLSVKADSIYNVDMKINILKDGTANITETWDVKASSGSEWYKQLINLGNSSLSNFTVSMDGKQLTKKTWNVNETIKEKAGYYGINYISEGLELCFGKSDKKRHTFVLNYTLSNYIINTSDSQVLYWTLFPNVTLDNFQVTVTSYYEFPDTLDVWGYGYKGYAYVQNGKIQMSNEGSLNNEYVVLLAKFPLNTFETTNTYYKYNTFNDVYMDAEKDTFDYDYSEDYQESYKPRSIIISLLQVLINFLPFIVITIFATKTVLSNQYGYRNNKKIDKKNIPMFREIPCDKNIYYANTLIKLNNFEYKEGNILGAIILKWVKENKIKFQNKTTGIFNKETSIIDLTLIPSFDNELEQSLFDMMYESSKDGLLEAKEFERWARNNYSKFLNLFKKIENSEIEKLKQTGLIYKRVDKNECKKKNVMNDKMYEDSVKLYGLKLFLQEFSRIDTKEVLEVHLWDEYLMFAYLFGIADKVAKQLKNMYPEVLEQYDNLDYDTLIFVNHISTRTVSAASSARSAAESYSSGGGGFSSGGGGGGSFGGGGGGSMGGR